MASSIAKGITYAYLPEAALVTGKRDSEPGSVVVAEPGSEAWPVVAGERESAGRRRTVKIAVVLVGVVNLVVAGILIGIPGFRTTLDRVPTPAGDRGTPPAAALSRSPAATPAPTSGPPDASTRISSTPALAAPDSTPAAAPDSAGATTSGIPDTPGAVQPQGARATRTREPRPRPIRPRAVRPKKPVVIRHTDEVVASSSTTPSATPATEPPISPSAPAAQRRTGQLPGQAMLDDGTASG
ncbi:hypothetical protein [Nonomuraea turcica]|uniref:hypothetical protein n=1 Tax=Nonomuraea sp. G32 TaxID=3067274 RepID=UPI00273BBF0E|nr:hypothetical protein [Nonomuraea sp. G32]MDP4508463.1 hypothetical protein [Nonomuraea sp. G32]